MEIIGAIGIAGMLGNLGTSGYNAAEQSNALRDQIKQVQENNAQLDGITKGLLATKYQMTETMREQVQTSLDNYIDLKTKIAATKLLYDAEFRTIELSGIIILAIIFMMLVMKQFGFNTIIREVMFAPFIALWNYITGKKTQK